MKKFLSLFLEEDIGGRPLKVASKDIITKSELKSNLYIPVLCSEINPAHVIVNLVCTLDLVLADCFDIETANLILKKMNAFKLSGCCEEKLVIAHYNANEKSDLIKSLNALLAKVEKEIEILVDRQIHIIDRGY